MAKIKVDFTNVKESSGFNPKHMSEGDYRAVITKAELGKSKAGAKQIVLSVALKDIRSVVYPYYCGLDEKQLWKLRNVLIAAGNKVPKKAMSIDTDKLVGKEIGISLEDDEYDGKMKSVIAAVFDKNDVDEGLPSDDSDDEDDEVEEDEVEEDEEEEEEEAPAPKKRKSKKAPEPEPEEEDDEDEEEEDDEEPEEKPVSKRTAARRAAKAKAEQEAAEAEEDEDDEEEEEAPAPKRKKAKAKAKPAPVEEDEDDEDDDLDLDDI